MPKRIQRSRRAGWRKPKGAVIVDRTSRWGNPFKLVGDQIYINASYRQKIMDPWVWLCIGDEEKLLRLYKMVVTNLVEPGEYGFYISSMKDIQYWVNHFEKQDISELKGKDLVCFCPLDKPCHADILLQIVNKNCEEG